MNRRTQWRLQCGVESLTCVDGSVVVDCRLNYQGAPRVLQVAIRDRWRILHGGAACRQGDAVSQPDDVGRRIAVEAAAGNGDAQRWLLVGGVDGSVRRVADDGRGIRRNCNDISVLKQIFFITYGWKQNVNNIINCNKIISYYYCDIFQLITGYCYLKQSLNEILILNILALNRCISYH